ncbi:unnamed protein product [Brachionus calyciflorus]|uniref:Uncharacterized protein n=1 Tax=Brachionus calyciflorus TaxID=104777 RepID=A0A813LV79_9BILA|nr:unnamed protein product [Brachionus calyciflorus]
MFSSKIVQFGNMKFKSKFSVYFKVLCLFIFAYLIIKYSGVLLKSTTQLGQKNTSYNEEKNIFLNPDYEILDFENFDNIKGATKYIVPNVVHLIYLKANEIKFYQAINIYSIFLNQNPDYLMIHCDDCSFKGHYWNQINSISEFRNKIKLHKVKLNDKIFGQKYGWLEHASDTLRLLVLMNYGGMYFDNDVYVVKSLDKYRRYEMTISWDGDQEGLGIQVLIAHRNARLLKAHYDSYRTDYNNSIWYYTGGMVPAKIMLKHRYLAHVVKYRLGTQMLVNELYKSVWDEWKNLDTIHLLINHRSYLDEKSPIKEFNDTNIRDYNFTYGHMCREIITKLKTLYNIDFYKKSK